MIDVLAGTCLVLGSLLALLAGIGLVRFPDVLTRMHAATKPQTLGVLLILLGLALRVEDKSVLAVLGLGDGQLLGEHPRQLAAYAGGLAALDLGGVDGVPHGHPDRGRVAALRAAGAAGMAVVSAICAAADPAASTRDLAEAWRAPTGRRSR